MNLKEWARGRMIDLEPISFETARSLDCQTQNFLASAFWASFKSEYGWDALFFKTPVRQPFLSVLVRRVKGFFLAYIPMQLCAAPDTRAVTFRAAADSLKAFLPPRTLFIRFDPPLDFASTESCAAWKNSLLEQEQGRGVRFAVDNTQPPDTVILDLTLSEEELLSRMKSKWRYNIGLAKKKGVLVRRAAADTLARDIEIFYALYLETAARDKIAIHSRAYYESLLQKASARPLASLYIAEHEGAAIAAIITLFFNSQAVYLYGASSNAKRSLMAPYLLQWQAITDAKKSHCAAYDFYGIPPDDNPSHPMHGLYRFKTGFGGAVVHRPGSIDAPLSPLYALYRAAESLRVFYYKKFKKRAARGRQ